MGSLSCLMRDGRQSCILVAAGCGKLQQNQAVPAARHSCSAQDAAGAAITFQCCGRLLFWSSRVRVGCAGLGVHGTL